MVAMIKDDRNFAAHGWGRIEIITGCMFSGKTSRLIRRLEQAVAAGQTVSAFKHQIDRRYSTRDIVSHDGRRLPAQAIAGGSELLLRSGCAEVIGIDEGQFFDGELLAACSALRASGRRVIVAGLNLDCRGRPFSPMDQMAAAADDVRTTWAVCAVCRTEAEFTYRKAPLVAESNMVGGSEAYEPRCAQCFHPPQAARPA